MYFRKLCYIALVSCGVATAAFAQTGASTTGDNSVTKGASPKGTPTGLGNTPGLSVPPGTGSGSVSPKGVHSTSHGPITNSAQGGKPLSGPGSGGAALGD
jgi:hypothetical protein